MPTSSFYLAFLFLNYISEEDLKSPQLLIYDLGNHESRIQQGITSPIFQKNV